MTGNRWYNKCFPNWKWAETKHHTRNANSRKIMIRRAKRKWKQLFKKEIENEQRNSFID